MNLKPLALPANFTYIGVFLTFSCQLRCDYCVNHHGGDLLKARRMSKENWINGLNRIKTRPNLPIALQGGEPTAYKYFFEVVAGIEKRITIDLLTNLEIDVEKFCKNIPPGRIRMENNPGWISIRVSYHHGQSNFLELIKKTLELQRRGYSIGIWEIEHPRYINDVHRRKELATLMGVDYRIKEFLGSWQGKNYGIMRYDNAVNSDKLRHCDCKTSELLIAPEGNIFRCTSDLYAGRNPVGHILDEEPLKLGEWKHCAMFGKCNSCDIKVKPTDHFRTPGRTSVEIKNVSEPYADNKPVIDVTNTYGKK